MAEELTVASCDGSVVWGRGSLTNAAELVPALDDGGPVVWIGGTMGWSSLSGRREDRGGGPGARSWRADVQGMRALAVAMVVVYHLWSARLPGGFVGVDVFFVISGFLITSHLLAHPPQTMRAVVEFWGRRIRRLLPVAFFVIVIGLLLVVVLEPITQWGANASGAIAAGIYLENWFLAGNMVDYLASAESASVFRHFWSLSIEEQFYIGWPLLIGLAALLTARRTHRFRLVAGLGIGAVCVGSWIFSGYVTAQNPPQAYFVTTGRIWELAAGGVVAVAYPVVAGWLRTHHRLRDVIGLVGFVATIVSGFVISGDGFPGWIATLPVGAAMLVLIAGSGDQAGEDSGEHTSVLGKVMTVRPIQFLGDISYSVYLWHWAFIVILPWVSGHPLTWWEKIGIIIVTLGVSWGSKRQIEDRFRGSRPLGVPLKRTFIFLVVGMATVASAGVGVHILTGTVGDVDEPIAIPATATCVGPARLLDPACESEDPHGDSLLTSPLQAQVDANSAYADHCWWTFAQPTVYPKCQYGSESAEFTVGLVGNSHAGPYLTPLQELATANGWGVRTYLASGCYPSPDPLNFETEAMRQGCQGFTDQALDDMAANGVDLVVMSVLADPTTNHQVSLFGVEQSAQYERQRAGFAQVLSRITAADIPVVVIRDVPMPPDSVVDCVAQHTSDVSACDGDRDQRLTPDPLYDAAQDLQAAQAESGHGSAGKAGTEQTGGPGGSGQAGDQTDPESEVSGYTAGLVTTVDFTEAICDEVACHDVVGGVIVYFNRGHLTATFATGLAPYLESAITEGRGEA